MSPREPEYSEDLPDVPMPDDAVGWLRDMRSMHRSWCGDPEPERNKTPPTE